MSKAGARRNQRGTRKGVSRRHLRVWGVGWLDGMGQARGPRGLKNTRLATTVRFANDLRVIWNIGGALSRQVFVPQRFTGQIVMPVF